MKLDINKLKCLNLSYKHNAILHRIPLVEYMERIILSNEDEINILPDEDKRMFGHKVRLFLDKNILPPMIYVHVDNEFAAQYTYYDEEFLKKSNLEIDD